MSVPWAHRYVYMLAQMSDLKKQYHQEGIQHSDKWHNTLNGVFFACQLITETNELLDISEKVLNRPTTAVVCNDLWDTEQHVGGEEDSVCDAACVRCNNYNV